MTIKFLQIASILAVTSGIGVAGEIWDLYNKSHPGSYPVSPKSRRFAETSRQETDIKEVGIERTACFGYCPVYTLIVKSDGSFRYSGDAHVERKGKFTGKVRLWRLLPLLQYIRDMDYFSLDERYQLGATDQDTVLTTVVKGDRRKTISNYGNAGPIRLWALQQLIDNLLIDAEWNVAK